jgi:glycosyltransferase involved in cell wall biosynthesis
MENYSGSKPYADVTIVAANYNNGSYLEAFIRSVMESTVLPAELIIVDDGSTDNSRDIIKAYASLPFLKSVLIPGNQGFTAALNRGLEKARSKYVMRADPDDLLMPDRIEQQFAYLENNPEVDMLGCNAIYFSEVDGRYINRSNFPLSHQDIVTTYFNGEHGLLHATVCGKREVYQKYQYQHLSPGEDYELFARMVKDGHRFANLKNALYRVRIHKASSTSQLKINAIRQTFFFRDQIFGTRTSWWKVWVYYKHIYHYRQSQLSQNVPGKYAHLFIAILLYPKKLLRRL